jgi:CHAD domain-containing protein
MIDGPALAPATEMAGQFLVARLRAYDTRLAETVPGLLSGGSDVPGNDEAVHDFRVALRRTRTLLEVGRPVFGRFHADEVRSALRDVQRATGALRDEEVLLDLLGSIEGLAGDGHHPAPYAGNVRVWIDSRRRRERRLRSALRRRVREGELDRGRYLLAALVAFRIKPSRDRRVTKFARRAVDVARREVEHRRRAPLEDPEALHDLRIACKRLRYTVEAFTSVLPLDLVDLTQTATRLQNRLGRLHDVDLAIASVKGARQLLDVGRDALLAALQRVRKDRVAAVEHELSGARIGPAPVKVRHAENGAGRASSA